MKYIRRESYLLLWLAAGWLIAAVGANRLFASGLVNYQILYGFITRGWESAVQGQTAGVLKILAVRLAETAVIVGICRSHFRGPGIPLMLLSMGLSAGISLVLFTWCRGVFGIFCFLLSGFPQGFFYLAAWGILILKYAMSYEVRKGKFWSMVLALLLLGICSEIWLNPVFLRFL